mmetsp:Transcript_28381/g.25102  ORF Transcript_28381/g.25102 Transcript_28381/m.25102 type:complete len:162 (+) Transcript_28381:31-516(+)
MKIYYHQPQVNSAYDFFRYLHMISIIVDLAFGVFLFNELDGIFYIGIYHSPFLLLSLIYHMMPLVGRSKFFVGIVKAVFGLSLVIGIILIIQGFNAPTKIHLLYFGIAFLLFFPGVVITGTLLLMIGFKFESSYMTVTRTQNYAKNCIVLPQRNISYEALV